MLNSGVIEEYGKTASGTNGMYLKKSFIKDGVRYYKIWEQIVRRFLYVTSILNQGQSVQ